MTFSQLKIHVAALLKSRREVSIPTSNDELIPLVHQNMLNIANRYKVIGLITKSENFRVLRALGDGNFIRTPKAPRNDTDKIDMDEELTMAIANHVAGDLASSQLNRNIFKKNARKIVKDYSFKIYNTKSTT